MKPIVRKTSLKWRIFFFMILFCVLLLAVLWLFQIVFLDKFYKSIKLMEIRRDASAIGDYVLKSQWDSLSGAISGREDLYVEVWAVDSGTIVVTGSYNRDAIQAKLSQMDKLALFQEVWETGSYKISSYYSEGIIGTRRTVMESILYSEVLAGESGKVWMILVSANISPLDATVDTLRYQLYIVSSVMLVLAIITALVVSKYVSRPIDRLNKAAAEWGGGNYGVAFPSGGYREIGQLADTLSNAAAELEKTDELRRELIANVSHDLRTPLTLITGYSEMMRDIPGENSPENMQVVIDESKRLSSLVTDLLDLSRLESGTTAPELCIMPLTACVREIIDRFARFTEQDAYTIQFDYDQEVMILGDRMRISQVVYNLIINAMTYTGQDKRVYVSQTIRDGRVAIRVTDTGEGIAPENLANVWERYYRVEKVHKRAITGTGLGLSIVRAILNRHPGVDYGVESKMGRGSTFWFELPMANCNLD